MVKSQYYYIVGFSRPDNKIEIAFDFESELHSHITESVLIDFASDEEFVLFHSKLNNIPAIKSASTFQTSTSFFGNFSMDSSGILYDLKIRKDSHIPTSIEKMNEYILCAKRDIITFMEEYYSTICSD